MQEFDEQGTRKLKDTVEKELGNILDRLESLTSDQCSYDTFSGKAKDMEGNVNSSLKQMRLNKMTTHIDKSIPVKILDLHNSKP